MVVIPIVIYGMRALERLQFWTTPLWLALALLPLLWVIVSDPDAVSAFSSFTGDSDGSISFGAIVASAAVCFALTPQLAEQIDYIRAMPPRTPSNRAVVVDVARCSPGPGWVHLQRHQAGDRRVPRRLPHRAASTPPSGSRRPNRSSQFIAMYEIDHAGLAGDRAGARARRGRAGEDQRDERLLRVARVVERLHPADQDTTRAASIFIFFNLAIALALMWMDVFSLISFVLSLYANVVMAWLVTIAADIAINKHVLRISPLFPEFRRGMLHDWNPVGLVSVGLASVLSLRGVRRACSASACGRSRC